MDKVKAGIILGVVISIVFLLIFLPVESIRVKKTWPVQFVSSRPSGLLQAYNYRILLSYGTLLKRSEKEFFGQLLIFNSSEYSSSYFSSILQAYREKGFDINLTSYRMGKKCFLDWKNESSWGLSIIFLKDNKIYYVFGDKREVERVMKWFISLE
jgi:hypothetical protein